jgi:3',5'-cyclic AMP phosphodiesterase CpdA
MRLAWLTDPHLGFLSPAALFAFLGRVAATPFDALVVTGDVSEAHDVAAHVRVLADRVRRPVYFVLGNHDFYGGSIAEVRREAAALSREHPFARWLPAAGVVPLTAHTALVGHDGWADGRLGDLARSPVQLNDFLQIRELTGLDAATRRARLEALGDEAAAFLARVVADALDRFEHVVVATHVPPFREACWHEGRLSNDDFLPFFATKSAGDALAAAMRARPDRSMRVLCGHTHGAGEATLLPNLRVLTGAAEYGAPALQRAIAVD